MKRYIFTHKDIDPVEGYEIIDNRKSVLDHRIWSELAGYKTLFDRLVNEKDDNGMQLYADGDWISLNHYRRHFDEDLCDRTCIAAPMSFNCTLGQHYQQYHNGQDVNLCVEAIKEEFPSTLQNFINTMNGNILIPYNMCICTVSQFRDYFTYLYKILENVNKKIGTTTYKQRLNYVNRHPELYTGEGKNNEPAYQMRIEAFLGERISTAYWLLVSKKASVFPCKVNLLEEGMKV